jgi:UDP-N-acetylglucosamine acyltransferase
LPHPDERFVLACAGNINASGKPQFVARVNWLLSASRFRPSNREGCRIFHGASIGLIPQDKKFTNEKTSLFIGKNTVVREHVTLNRGTLASGATRIGNNCWIMAYCHVAHDCVLGDDVTMSNSVNLAGHVVVGNHVTIGGVLGVHQFTRIGDYSIIGAMSRPFMDIVPYAMCGGEGETRIIGINKVGLERQGFSAERRQNIKRAYKTLFREDLSLQDAVVKLVDIFPEDEDVRRIIDFVKGSSRGIMRMKVTEFD